jgi:hypothetical protein
MLKKSNGVWGMDWIYLAKDRDDLQAAFYAVINFHFHKML